ncbi:MAG: 2,3-bisphosphoglycerate-independent phosphoglycerate mutase [Candidatus Colwellbacteria bacterium]|nr:2,3-bisphosphoglycerate-independent phosphoglycerate mutase [Candidatus Colwellbacteria bacterium]
MRKRTVVLVILDGWGIGRDDQSNPIYTARPENINYIRSNYPSGTLQASGIAVGLPWGEEGNSEVGHLTLGAGKVLFAHYPRISLAIRDKSFFKNQVLLEAFRRAKSENAKVNLVGALSQANIHSSLEHLEALLALARAEGVGVSLHLFADGRDGPPKGAHALVGRLPEERIASISGRFYSMDRDFHWDRSLKAYRAMIGEGASSPTTIPDFINSFYNRGLTDEFIEPAFFKSEGAIKPNDSVIFFNFREDSARQLVSLFLDPDLGEKHQIPANLHLVTFTRYSAKLNLPVAFPPEEVTNPLGRILSDAGKIQLRVAETEKYAHVTYFFNGFREPPYKNEYRVLVPSRSVVRHDEYPEMMAGEITTRVLTALAEGIYDFILVNYANPDVIAHSGNLDAAIKAVKTVDTQIRLLLKATLEHETFLIITSDHGNVERMYDPRTGQIETSHDPSPVPVYLVFKGYERQKDERTVKSIESQNTGVLSDVAPTILELMGLPKPEDMTGISLMNLFR